MKTTLTQPPEVIVVPLANYELQVVGIPWTNWFQDGPGHMAHRSSAEFGPCTKTRFRSKYGVRKALRGSSGNISWTPSIVGSLTGGGASTNASAPQSRKGSSSLCPSSTRTRPFIGRSARQKRIRFAPETRRAAPTPPAGGTAGVRPRSGLELSRGPEPRPRARARRDAQLDFQRAMLQRIPQDCRTSGAEMARSPVRV